MFLILTAGLAEDSWTPVANSMIDVVQQTVVDSADFLRVEPVEPANAKQRDGRVGRVADSLILRLQDHQPLAEPLSLPYTEHLQLVLASADLKYNGPVPGIDAAMYDVIRSDLVGLGCLRSHEDGVVASRTTFESSGDSDPCTLTALGMEAMSGSLDVCASILIRVGATLGVEYHARIAVAYMQGRFELFNDLMPDVCPRAGLVPEQVALGLKGGDVHTAVSLYILWLSRDKKFSKDLNRLIKIPCFINMAAQLSGQCDSMDVAKLGDARGWEEPLMYAIAFAKQKQIACRWGSGYASCHESRDKVRPDHGLDAVPVMLQVSNRSLCHASYFKDGAAPQWITYGATGHAPNVKSVTHLSPNVAAMFTHHNISWDCATPIDFRAAMCTLLNNRANGVSPGAFIGMLSGQECLQESCSESDTVVTELGDVGLLCDHDDEPSSTCLLYTSPSPRD